MTNEIPSVLVSLSNELANVVERVAPSVVRVDDGSRLTATGIVWSADGSIITTSHGVERDEDLTIELHDGTRHAAKVVGRDHDTDLALLRVDAQNLTPIEHAPNDAVKTGHLVLALGRPGDAGLQATIGIISARLESQSNGQPEYVLHTDAVFYPGFSGGPLVNTNGQAVGLNNLVYGRGRGVALGLPTVTHVADALLEHGQVQRGYLGIRMQLVALPTHLRQSLNLSQEQGLLIVQVENGSPAEKGGLLLGDTLLSFNGHTIEDVEELRHELRDLAAGQNVTLRILRGGEVRDVNVTLQAATS
ncbi:MAG: trypsin-like peptidase domain-containing protein [Abitibacteriaceae bacterium]|nr:trypsin-like peptidase domain-containing protein [Abditibacteriaceae bacterium]